MAEPSRRGLANLSRGKLVDSRRDLEGRERYDPVRCPNGLADASGATNGLMNDWMAEYCKTALKDFSFSDTLGYGPVSGASGLWNGLSRFFNKQLSPAQPVKPQEILVTNGVTALLDLIVWNVPWKSSLGDHFSAENARTLVQEFEKKYHDMSRKGIVVKAVVISNPSNPLGRCYSRESLLGLARFCAKYRLHFISDEIYALSTFQHPQGFPSAAWGSFTSVLSLTNDPDVDSKNIHLLYGVSKDFGMGGLRLGFAVTRNPLLWKTMRKVSMFTWITKSSEDFFTQFINDEINLENYIQTYQRRLRDSYIATSRSMQENGIPFDVANGELFVWIDLNKWLVYFHGPDQEPDARSSLSRVETRETQLSLYLISRNVFLSQGKLSESQEPGRFQFVYTVSPEMTQVTIKRIRAALEDLERNGVPTETFGKANTEDNARDSPKSTTTSPASRRRRLQ